LKFPKQESINYQLIARVNEAKQLLSTIILTSRWRFGHLAQPLPPSNSITAPCFSSKRPWIELAHFIFPDCVAGRAPHQDAQRHRLSMIILDKVCSAK
jgi:hypothetical protein